MRKKIKKPLTKRAEELAILELNKLSKDIPTQIKIIEQSVFKSWQGFFELKNYDNKPHAINNDIKNDPDRNKI